MRYKKVRKSASWDQMLFHRYARSKGFRFAYPGYFGAAIGVEGSPTMDRIAFLEQRGLPTRYRIEARYNVPDDRKRCFDFILSNLNSLAVNSRMGA